MIIYITGMSGTGKSSLIECLQNWGHAAIDTDYGDWKEAAELDGATEWILKEEKLRNLLLHTADPLLFISGCCSNQHKFYQYFDYKVLLSAPLHLLLERIMKRHTNPYGKTAQERDEIIWNYQNIQPLLKAEADFEFDTEKMRVEQIANELLRISKE